MDDNTAIDGLQNGYRENSFRTLKAFLESEGVEEPTRAAQLWTCALNDYLYHQSKTNSATGADDEQPLLGGSTALGNALREGIDPPEVFEPDILLRGKVHSIFCAPGKGKSWTGLYLVAQAISRGERVMFLDMENGARIISERLSELEADPAAVDSHLYYFDSPERVTEDYIEALDTIEPDLVLFDSWVSFIAAAGYEENSNDDMEKWSLQYAKPARNRGITVVILDHVPHEGSHARGATRKKDAVDVEWELKNPKPFDRGTVGEITLHRRKDREAWLGATVKFSVGGGEAGFMFARSEGTVDLPSPGELTDRASAALETLRDRGGGLTFGEWRKACGGIAKSTFARMRDELMNGGLAYESDGRYYPAVPASNEQHKAPPVPAVPVVHKGWNGSGTDIDERPVFHRSSCSGGPGRAPERNGERVENEGVNNIEEPAGGLEPDDGEEQDSLRLPRHS